MCFLIFHYESNWNNTAIFSSVYNQGAQSQTSKELKKIARLRQAAIAINLLYAFHYMHFIL
jgi:hypothetical protein